MDDYLALLRQNEEKVCKEREQREAEQLAKRSRKEEWDTAWQAVVQALVYGDQFGGIVPANLSVFLDLAKLLKSRGYDIWLPEMAANFAADLDSHFQYRPGQLFIANLLIAACKPRASLKTITKIYNLFMPSIAPAMWRTNAAREVGDFISNRVDNAEKEQEAAKSAARQLAEALRADDLRAAAKRRPALHKQLFAAYWSEDGGLTPAKIRDKWNEANPKDKVESGESGRDDIKKAAGRGRKFLNDNSTTADEMASVLGLRLR